MPKIHEPLDYDERIAINVLDLQRMEKDVRTKLLAGKLELQAAIKMSDDEPDEVGVVFDAKVCSLLASASICDMIREQDRVIGETPTRVYLRLDSRKKWVKVPDNVLLSVVVGGKCKLNPALFPNQVKQAPVIPLPTKPIM